MVDRVRERILRLHRGGRLLLRREARRVRDCHFARALGEFRRRLQRESEHRARRPNSLRTPGRTSERRVLQRLLLIPAVPSDATNWNLLHFRGGNGLLFHGLWDVSLTKGTDGAWRAYVFDFLRSTTRATNGVPAVPIGSWFRLEVYWKRAADATGELAVYQDGAIALDLTNLVTDEFAPMIGYVGDRRPD